MLNSLLKIHKKTVLVGGNGFSVDCVLKQNAAHTGWPIKGFSTFIGLMFDEKGVGYFGDSFELTLDIEDVKAVTDLVPVSGWFVEVTLVQFNNDKVLFYIEDVPIDRTLGMYLLKCSASTTKGQGRRVDRNGAGGI